MKMQLTDDQLSILNGDKGPVYAKVMQTLIRYGELFGAKELVPITSQYNHLVTSFGLKALGAIYQLIEQLIQAGVVSKQKFSCDPRPMDSNVPTNFLQRLIFKKFMYSRQESYEEQLKKIGLMNEKAFTCTPYMPEIGNTPKYGDILSWSESSAVVYANSVLGARCNRNSGIIDLMCSIVGYAPAFGFIKDENRKAKWIVEVRTTKKPEAQLLGSAVGMKAIEDVPYVVGLDKWLPKLDDDAKAYLKDFGAATASNGAVGLYHIDGLTPEAVKYGKKLILPDAKTYVIDDDEIERVQRSYPIVWKNKNAKPKLCFIGCPHLSLSQLSQWVTKIDQQLTANQYKKVVIPTVLTAAPDVVDAFKKTKEYDIAKNRGLVLSSICPLMYMNNPLCSRVPTITSSNKLRTYTTARYYRDDELLTLITKKK